MKKIGIIGGLGPEATMDYYKRIIDHFNRLSSDLNYPEIILYSVNMSEFIGLMNKGEHDLAISRFVQRTEALKNAGAEFAVISANTPHRYFEEINDLSPLPMISIVEATCAECQRLGLMRPGLFGTGLTMNSTFYQKVFDKKGIEVIVPTISKREIINQKLFSEIELGIFKPETKLLLIDIIQEMVEEQHIDSLILGCTEFPLILNEDSYAGIPMLNTTQLHIDAIINYCNAEI
jgi:aspartate racemase